MPVLHPPPDETLTCENCKTPFTRQRTRGRKPRFCPSCRVAVEPQKESKIWTPGNAKPDKPKRVLTDEHKAALRDGKSDADFVRRIIDETNAKLWLEWNKAEARLYANYRAAVQTRTDEPTADNRAAAAAAWNRWRGAQDTRPKAIPPKDAFQRVRGDIPDALVRLEDDIATDEQYDERDGHA